MDNSRILDINNDIRWIGILDDSIVTFDIVMETKHGTTIIPILLMLTKGCY